MGHGKKNALFGRVSERFRRGFEEFSRAFGALSDGFERFSKSRCPKVREILPKWQVGKNNSGEFDPFGDFDLLFGAAKLNRKFVEIPIRYQARTYGSTQISRFRHGLLLLQMAFFALWKIKFI